MSYLSIAHLVRDKANTQPNFDVLTFEHNGTQEVRNYLSLWQRSQCLAQGLKACGFQSGDRLGILLQNHPEFIETMVAAAILGLVFVPLDSRMKGEKLAFMLSNAHCRGVVCGDYAITEVGAVADSLPLLDYIIVVGEQEKLLQAPRATVINIRNFITPLTSRATPTKSTDKELEIAVTNIAEPMQIMYTSGTTGDPKGIVIPHARFMTATGFGEELFGYRAGDRPYTGLSLTHGNAQFVTLAPALSMGLGAVFSRKFTKSRLWDIISRNQCTSFSLLGGMATAIYSEPANSEDANNTIRHIVSAGMSVDIWDAFRQRFNVEIIEFYGAMEGGMLINPMGIGPVGSCGKAPSAFNVRIVDESGADVPLGEQGELLFGMADGTPMHVEYLGLPKTSVKKTQEGWLCSGDVVVSDAQGWIFYHHRLGGGIRHNGDFINPVAIEKIVAECPFVSDVFVWGVPAASGSPGEKDVVATVVLKPIDSLELQDLFTWCRKRLEANMVPSYFQIVTEIPKTASEKPQERFLKQAFNEAHENVLVEAQAKPIDKKPE